MSRRYKHVSSDIFLILTSLTMAFVVWMIAKEGDLGQATLVVGLEITNVPSNIDAKFSDHNVIRTTTQITISAPKSLVAMLKAEHFRIELDWDDLKPDKWPESLRIDRPVTLKEDQIVIAGHLSQDLKESIHRNVLYLSLEPRKVNFQADLITRPATIEIRTKGEVAKDYQLASPPTLANPEPPILVTASAQLFRNLGSLDSRTPIVIPTVAVALDDHDKDFTADLSLDLRSSGVTLAPGQEIRAIFKIQEIITTRVIPNVPLTYSPSDPDLVAEWTPSSVSVTLEGPQRVLRDLVPLDLEIRPTEAPEENGEAQQSVPLTGRFSPSARPGITDSTTIESVNPSEAHLRFQSRNLERKTLPD